MVEITPSALADKQALLSSLLALVGKRKADAEFEQFVMAYIPVFCVDEWRGRQLRDLYHACYSLWSLFEKIGSGQNKIRVFNPNIDEDGWICGRTVIIIACEDSPFLVDSIRIELNRRELPIHMVKSTVLDVTRDGDGSLSTVGVGKHHAAKTAAKKAPSSHKEALIYFEVSTLGDDTLRSELRASLAAVLIDVQRVVTRYRDIKKQVANAEENVSLALVDDGQKQQAEAFMHWLSESHFMFLGYREYDLLDVDADTGDLSKAQLVEKIDARLGIFEKLDTTENTLSADSFPEGVTQFYGSDQLICFSKSSTRSNVHRAVYPDYIVLKKFNAQGHVIGEVRFLGLYTYSVLSASPLQIPILKEKVDYLIERSGIDLSSHDGRSFMRIIENYPKDELFQADANCLYSYISDIVAINERHLVRLILRKDLFGSFVTCMVYVPRDLYTTRTRMNIERVIGEAIGSNESDSMTYFSESNLARAQFVFRVDPHQEIDIDVAEIERCIADVTRNWSEQLSNALLDHFGESKGASYFHKYRNAFSQSYQAEFDARAVIHDVQMLESLKSENDIAMNFYQPVGSAIEQMKFKIMHFRHLLELSTAIPILENLGLRVLGEQPYKITMINGDIYWMQDFTLKFALPITLDINAVKTLFERAFQACWQGVNESDAFNRLVLAARLSWREVSLLRVYANYLKQTRFASSVGFIADTLVAYPDITRNILALFKACFDPRLKREDNSRVERLQQKILESIDNVANLNQDKVLRRYLDLVLGSLRTNFYQKDNNGDDKAYISIKFSPRTIDDIPKPRPLYEIFVYSPRMEGVHLRGGDVARGGLRWSDRYQDYRTEVLGLVKAQQVKNAVIVPTGAKGGFVAKNLPAQGSRQELMDEGIACYQLFIRGLLDVTDNLVRGDIVAPRQVVRRDGDDPYLVVAADKGTATFSDIANAISLDYGHWLGDAFASGGSQGYDHKGMGITARGAWVSVQRHFRELGIDVQTQDFSVIGIGDMAGDVFGNGMLLSEHICLRAAFNHMHIFIDPEPDAAASFAERQRLFNTPGTSWADYNDQLISKGGGVFHRSAKSIDISPQMRKAFAIEAKALTPNDFIHALLKAPIDLLWNGGIGTYVKSSRESHADVGDKTNDALRIDGCELRAKVIGEGGNLGFTQLGRIEYALNGGACNTDFIDNAAGVDCSDHEVNIKILLDECVANGDLTQKQRNKCLVDMTDAVADLVLQNNDRQTLALSVAQSQVLARTNEYRRFIDYLESLGRLDRALEFMPSDEDLLERIGRGKTLTRPELSVLISYAKAQLKEELFQADICDDDYIAAAVATAFPDLIREKYFVEMNHHRLQKEIVGTQVANDMVNNLGITAAHRLMETTGANYGDIARAYIVSRDIFQFEEFHHYLKSLDNQVPATLQASLVSNMVRRVRRGTRWFLRNRRGGFHVADEVKSFQPRLQAVRSASQQALTGTAFEQWQQRSASLMEQGINEKWAQALSMPDNLFSGIGIIAASTDGKYPIEQVTKVFFMLLERLHLNWFATQLSEVKVETYWQALARESFIDDLEAQMRRLSISFLRLREASDDPTIDDEAFYLTWEEHNRYLVDRWKAMVKEVESVQVTDYAMFSVALRELIDLTQATEFIEKL